MEILPESFEIVQMLIIQKRPPPLPLDVWALWAGCRRRQSFDACNTTIYIGRAGQRLGQKVLVFLTPSEHFPVMRAFSVWQNQAGNRIWADFTFVIPWILPPQTQLLRLFLTFFGTFVRNIWEIWGIFRTLSEKYLGDLRHFTWDTADSRFSETRAGPVFNLLTIWFQFVFNLLTIWFQFVNYLFSIC